MYTNSNLLHICSSLILATHSFTWHLAINLFTSAHPFDSSFSQPPQTEISLKPSRGKHIWRKLLPYLEEDLSCHGESMSDDRLLIRGTALPAIQLHAAAASQQRLAIHLRRRDTRKLTSWRRAGGRLNISYSHGTVAAQTGAAELSAILGQVYVAD